MKVLATLLVCVIFFCCIEPLCAVEDNTPQPESDYPNGYEALAVFDASANGGTGDGMITIADAIFSDLLFWVDKNKNGESEPSELTKLSQSHVESINLRYRSSRRQDRYGNQMRFLSKVSLNTGHWVWSTDVFFLVATDK